MTTLDQQLLDRYGRIADQLGGLYATVRDPLSRMASAVALLHAKQSHFYWTGFYRCVDEDLLVGPYQGPLACMLPERGQGVCWATVERGSAIVVPDVHAFEGHIACDPRSKSEVVVPFEMVREHSSPCSMSTANEQTLSTRRMWPVSSGSAG